MQGNGSNNFAPANHAVTHSQVLILSCLLQKELPQTMEYPIDVNKKGRFIVIKQLNHKLQYVQTNQEVVDWGKRKTLNYEADWNKLKETFKLEPTVQMPGGKVFRVLGEDLTNSPSRFPRTINNATDNTFDKFMDDVCKYDEENPPEFVMFFLMSHGFENGDFLLASEGQTINRQEVSDPPCCQREPNERHSRQGACFARNIFKDVIKRVCDAYPKEIPKIFIIQCCRGSEEKNIEGVGQPLVISNPSDNELFIPDYPNTLVLRASVEGYVAHVKRQSATGSNRVNGSLLIQYLCKAITDLMDTDIPEYKNLLSIIEQMITDKKVKTEQSVVDQQRQLLRSLKERREDLTGGWIMNICQRTTALVANYLFVEVILNRNELGRLVGLTYEKAPAELRLPKYRQEFPKALEDYKQENPNLAENADQIKLYCSSGRWNSWHVFWYMWLNVRSDPGGKDYLVKNMPTEQKEAKSLQEALDAIIEDIHDLEPYSKQQPQVSSTLSQKLSCIELMESIDQQQQQYLV